MEKSGNSEGQGQPTQVSRRNSAHRNVTSPKNEVAKSNTGSKHKTAKGSKKQSEKMARTKKKMGIMSVIALVCILLGTSGMILWQSFFDNLLKKELALSPNSTSYKMWKETPIPMYLKIYLYDWTNHDKISQKPNFVQRGPYTFREVNYKVNQTWNDNNGTVTFRQRRVWHFIKDLSKGTLSDKVTTINPIAMTIAYTVRNSNKLIKTVISKALSKVEKIAVTKTVKEFLFDGYDDVLLKLAADFNISSIPFDKFGWFYSRNGSHTYDGIFNILTGVNNVQDIGMLKTWKYDSVSPYYSKTCGELKGTTGDLWPPIPNNKTVSVFSPDICTTLTLELEGEAEWLGITGHKFVSTANMLDNGTNVESRKCYCSNAECQPSGTLNVSSCKFGAPAFVSLPHFYLADKSYTENITGMNPNEADHKFILIVHPETGIPMQVRATLQINFLVQPDEDLTYFKDFPRMYVPMLWFTQEVNLTSEYAGQVKLLALLPPLGKWISIGIISIGVLLILVSIILYIRQRRDDMNENLIPKDRDNVETETNVNNDE